MKKKKNNQRIEIIAAIFFLLTIGLNIFILFVEGIYPNSDSILYFYILMVVIFVITFIFITIPFIRVNNFSNEVIQTIALNRETKDMRNVTAELFDKSYFNEEYDYYKETIKALKEDSDESGYSVPKIIASEDAADFFNDEAVNTKSYLSIFNYIPHVFISIGIFGTFFGIVTGLDGLGTKISGGSTETIRSGIDILLSSVQISFRSSLYGILFSVIFALYYKVVMSINKKSVYQIALKLNTIFSYTPEIQELYEIKREIQSQTPSIENLATNMSEELSKLMENIFEKQNVALNQMSDSVSGSISNIGAQSLDNLTEPIADLLSKVTEQYKKNGELLEILEKFNVMFAKNVEVYSDVSSKVNESMGITKEQLEKITENVLQKMTLSGELSEDIRKENLKYIDSLVTANNSYKDENSRYIEEFNQVIQVVQDIHDKLNQNILESKLYVEQIYSTHEINMDVLKEQNNTVSQLQNDIHNNLGEYSKLVNKGLNDIFSQYDDNATKVLGNTKNVVEEMSESVNNIIDSIKLLSDVINQQNDQIEKVRQSNVEVVVE